MGELGFLSWEKRAQQSGLNLNSGGAGAEELTRNLADYFHTLAAVILYAFSWFARMLLVFIPQRFSFYGMSNALDSFSTSSSGQNKPFESKESEIETRSMPRSGPIERALLQVLALVNDIPVSSTKYSFARSLAEKIIQENASHGHGYESVNRAALSAGFERTLVMLNRSLEGIHQQNSSGDLFRWPLRMLRMIPNGGFRLVVSPSLSLFRAQICYFISSLSKVSSTTTIPSSSWDLLAGSAVSALSAVGNAEMAEKLAQELLWLAEKLAEISALDEGIAQWSASSSLASLSLRSSPHVQRALVRLTSLFVKELVTRNFEVDMDVKYKLLLRWLPLFCASTHGGDGPILTVSERMDLEHNLDRIIKAFPDSDQEVVLAVWLQEFALSSSDWPNLQLCYDNWCKTTRRLVHSGRCLEAS